MADTSSSNFQIPWPTMIAAITAIGGLLWYMGPPSSSRPVGEPASQALKPPGIQEFDARLWQDPLRIASKAYAADSASGPTSLVRAISGACYEHAIGALTRQHSGGNRTILPVMLEQGPYSDAIEHRRRQRNAIINGLNQANYVPDDPYHIGYVTVDDWPVFTEPAEARTAATPRPLVIPYEWFRKQGSSSDYVVVLWLDEGEFDDSPLLRIQNVLEKLDAKNSPVKIIGPRGSSSLERLEAEVKQTGNGFKQEWWGNVEFYTPTATVPEEIVERRIASERNTAAQTVSAPVAAKTMPSTAGCTPPDPAVKIYRTVTDDFDLSKALVKELKLRGVDVEGGDYVAIVSEWDTFYGRMLPVSFVAAAAGVSREELGDVYSQRNGEPHAKKSTSRLNCDLFSYLRGIDGQTGVPESGPKVEKSGDNSKSASKNPLKSMEGTADAPEGDNQYDYLRRMAEELKRRDAEKRSKGESGLKAIGVLGSDVYDKLIVLQVLRPQFPDAIVFTTDLDARLGSPTEADWAHNLIVASSFDLQIATQSSKLKRKRSPFEQDPPPFRDSGQTAVYCATLAAFGVNNITPSLLAKQPVSLFEIGRNGPVRLDTGEMNEGGTASSSVQPAAERWTVWWTAGRVVATAALAILLLALFLCLRPSRQVGKGLGWRAPTRIAIRRWWSSPGNRVLVIGLSLCVMFVILILVFAGGSGAPLSLFDGVSLWPASFIRLIAIGLAIWFMVSGYDAIETADHRIEHEYWLRNASSGTAARHWLKYLEAGLWKPRSKRIVAMSVTYLLCGMVIAMILGWPSPPRRGTASLMIEQAILLGDGILFVLLTFFVVDATMLARQLIRSMSRCRVAWPYRCVAEFKKLVGLTEEDAADLLDIRFIARLTAPVMHLIYYPFIVLTLMIVARLSFFGNGGWSAALIVIYSLNSLLAVYAAHILRRAAEEARERTLDRLSLALSREQGKDAARIEQLKLMMREIRDIREGAFASFGNNPIIGAVLLPASVGVLSFLASLSQAH